MADALRRTLLKGLAGMGAAAAVSPLIPQLARASELSTPEWMELRRRAGRLANYATFGANEATVERILGEGWESWVDAQLALPVTPLYPAATLWTDNPGEPEFHAAWWTNVLAAPDQLHQRVGFALSQWFVVSTEHPLLSRRVATVVNYYDMLLQGATGSFDELLFKVSTHPAMCAYLSSLYNAKGSPERGTIADENYAREVMQLFSCGAELRRRNGNFKLDAAGKRIANYNEVDVQELARVYTGIGLAGTTNWGDQDGDWLSPVVEYPDYHDDGSKVLMGQSIPAGNGVFEDIRAAQDIILSNKSPSVAGNFCRFMIQRLTVSNPRYTYVRDVANVLLSSDWSIAAMVRAIMLHPDAVDGRSDSRAETGRLKEPMLWYASARRAVGPVSDAELKPVTGPVFNNRQLDTGRTFKLQAPLGAVSVFGFFPREYQAETIRNEGTDLIDYVYPEAYLYNANTVIRVSNKLWGNFVKYDAEVARFADVLHGGASDEEFVDSVLDTLLFGNYRPRLREQVLNLVAARQSWDVARKVRDALAVVLNAPEFLIINVYQSA